MCFSASASFGASAVLTAVGVASIKQAKRGTQVPFAGIPLIFAAQQVSEGFLWLSLTDPAFAQCRDISQYIFLFLAQVLWPVWVPLSILMVEPRNGKKNIEKALLGSGFLVSLYLAYSLIFYSVTARISDYHIFYDQHSPGIFGHAGILFYIIVTTAPPFISGFRRMWILGVPILVSYALTAIFYTNYIISVWCFFSALTSIIVFTIMHKPGNPCSVSDEYGKQA